jgi:putative endonuclease
MARACGPSSAPASAGAIDAHASIKGSSGGQMYYVYIMASARNGTLYIGVTNDIARRAWQHREGLVPGFTEQYGVKILVHIEAFEDVREAIARETRLKKWKRAWKINLIEQDNPDWLDLYESLNA